MSTAQVDTTSTPQRFEHWALVEIMGHQRMAGLVSETTLAGAAMLRVDVPAVGDIPEFTTFLGAASIYRLTPVSEDIARRYAAGLRAKPVQAYELPALPGPSRDDDDDDFDDED